MTFGQRFAPSFFLYKSCHTYTSLCRLSVLSPGTTSPATTIMTTPLIFWAKLEQYIWFPFHLTYVQRCFPVTQMQPLSADQMDDLDDVICIDASGTVTSIENNLPSFIIHGMQYVAGGQRNDDIALQAELQNNPKWSDPLERLPKLRAIVSIFGPLHSSTTSVALTIKT